MAYALPSIGLVELFEQEHRPIFSFDILQRADPPAIYQNAHLKQLGVFEELFAQPERDLVDPTLPADHSFSQWTLQQDAPEDKCSQERWHRGITWVKTTLRGRWRIIRGETSSHGPETEKLQDPTHSGTSPASVDKSDNEAFRIDMGVATGSFNSGGIDWAVSSTKARPSDCGSWIRGFDWSVSPLGPIETWNPQLQRNVLQLLADPRPAALVWGKDRCILYNERYAPIAGKQHPAMQGKRFIDAWPTVASFYYGNAVFILERNGYTEEMFCTWSMIPLVGDDGDVVAFYNPVLETTRQTLSLRRMELLLGLSQHLAAVNDISEYWQQVIAGLEPGVHDIPSLLIFGHEEPQQESLSFMANDTRVKKWQLKGSLGYPADLALPQFIDCDSTSDELQSLVGIMGNMSGPVLLRQEDGSLPASFIASKTLRGFGDRCDSAILCPIRPVNDDKPVGFLIIGVNPRRRYDSDYQVFADLLVRQLAASMAAMLLVVDQVQRTEARAALAKKQLSEQLAIRTIEVANSEQKFRRMADLAPVAMYHFDAHGSLKYANDLYHEMAGLVEGAEKDLGHTWGQTIAAEDVALAQEQWMKLIEEGRPVSFEVRLQAPRVPVKADRMGLPQASTTELRWIIVAAYPELDAQKRVIGVAGCFTDISRQKWAEGVQNRRMQEALELKRQQEAFIDMTSHELRNPLSAIVQCADSIISTFDNAAYSGAPGGMVPISTEEITDTCSAANTILFCALHQKRITDDVLMLSKLNSDLVRVTPIEVQPMKVIEGALRVFDRELSKSDTTLNIRLGESMDRLDVRHLLLDPSRLTQVLINLVGNSLKFVQTREIRTIDILIDASTTRQLPEHSHINFLPRQYDVVDAVSGPEWPGEIIYLHFAVRDSGPGMTPNEMQSLFQRFAQTTPRTHVEYGGSGLGLFISKRLTEVQGGNIGVASEAGVGSTFAFHIKARRCAAPVEASVYSGETRHDSGHGGQLPLSTTTRARPGFAAPSHDLPCLDVSMRDECLPSAHSKRRLSDGSMLGLTAKPRRSTRGSKHDDRIHVLICEDNLINQKVLAKQLRNIGYVVSIANHGKEALEHLQRTHYWRDHAAEGHHETIPLSVILMDLEMPVMDGLTCVQQIRSLQTDGRIEGHVPIIAVTANARSEQIAIAKGAGMDDVVCKPFRIPELVKQVETLLSELVIHSSPS